MDTTRLIDWSPVLHIMLSGMLLALGPLSWVWLRYRKVSIPQRLQRLTVLTLFLTFDLVLFGAFTRLTDSGLGCPDWPGCYGHASPVGAQAMISEAQAQMPSGPVTHEKAWIEMIHRYLAAAVGVLILTQALFVTWLAWRARRAQTQPSSTALRSSSSLHASGVPGESLNLWWPWATLVWVCLQGAFGAWTVTLKLFPAIVTLHLLGGLVLLVLLARQVALHRLSSGVTQRQPMPVALRQFSVVAVLVLLLQILLGGWVSTNYAVLACNTFPQCQGSWWPAMDFSQGFSLWRHLGVTSDGRPLDFEALTAIHYAHRLMAYAVLILLGALAWSWKRHGFKAAGRWLNILLLWQFLTGLSNVVLDWPLLSAVAHTGGSAALLLCLSWTLFTSRAATAVTISPTFTRPFA
ncbi:MAG: heme A synthase [Betaproteobacteria bacterium]|nr:heme A synthase [Betaproteobacteria bacterium]